MEYNIGDKIKIINKRICGMNREGKMDIWLGKTMTIKCKHIDTYLMEEDNGDWYWDGEMFEGIEDKIKVEVGQVVELKNGEMGFALPDRIIFCDWWIGINSYKENLEVIAGSKSLDIVAIYNAPITKYPAWDFSSENHKGLLLVWKREKKSDTQIQIEKIEFEIEILNKSLKVLKEGVK